MSIASGNWHISPTNKLEVQIPNSYVVPKRKINIVVNVFKVIFNVNIIVFKFYRIKIFGLNFDHWFECINSYSLRI